MVGRSTKSVDSASTASLREQLVIGAGIWSVQVNARRRNWVVDWCGVTLKLDSNEAVFVECVGEGLSNILAAVRG